MIRWIIIIYVLIALAGILTVGESVDSPGFGWKMLFAIFWPLTLIFIGIYALIEYIW